MDRPEHERFDHFMARALHDPDTGYYRHGLQTVGRRGDFSTSATLFPGLAASIAHWLKQKSKGMKAPSPVSVIEAGGGTGELMLGILKYLGWWERRKFRFHSVESSGPLQKSQQKLLTSYGVQWHPSMNRALEACRGSALVYSNELVDAFPCRVLSFRESVWKELSLRWEGRNGIEEWREGNGKDWDTLLKEAHFSCPQPKSGQVLEMPLSYHDWLASWISLWSEGCLLTIDYGGLAEELIVQHRYGTLRAYFKHMRLEGEEVHRRAGQQDITFDVNFSLLKKWGHALGLKDVSFETQSEFTRRMGQKEVPGSKEAQAQEMFKVLEQSR